MNFQRWHCSPDLRPRRAPREQFRSHTSLSLPLLELPEASTSKVRARHADTLAMEACQVQVPAAVEGRQRLLRNVFAALVATFMGATDGLSLGGLLFPSSPEFPNHEFQALGMSIGLLTTLVANAGSFFGSEVRFGVAGASIPTVIILAEYFKTLGAAHCATIYSLAALCTVLTGLGIWLLGYLRLARLVRACPFVVYGGFMAGTGAVLLQYALNLLLPDFTSLVDPRSYAALWRWSSLHQWLPGALAGLTMFALRAANLRLPGISEDLLIPTSLLAEAFIFLAWMLVTGCGLEEARAQGLLFPVRVPERLEFYKVWTQHWQLLQGPENRPELQQLVEVLCSSRFWLTVADAAFVSALTAVMNIFGTASAAQIRVDIDREVMLHGAYNVCSGLLSGLNANMVMSFSITCRTLGADGRQFQALLLSFSLLFFVLGDVVVALLPRCLPGSVLVWLSAELMAFWVWNSLSFLKSYEYGLVWLMIFIYVLLGTAPMLLLGFVAVSGIVSTQLATLPVIRTRRTLTTLRSARLHTTCDREFLNRKGAQAEVWVLGTAYLYFASMRQIVQALEDFTCQRHVSYQSGQDAAGESLPDFAFAKAMSCEVRKGPDFIVLDFDLVRQMESTAVAAFQEVLSVAAEMGCSLLLANADQAVLQQMERFKLPLVMLQDEIPANASGLLVAPTLEHALEMVEDGFLRRYQPPLGQCRDHTHLGLRSKLSRCLDPLSSLFGVWVDFHVWLAPHSTYRPELLAQLQHFVELRLLQEGEELYCAQGGGWNAEEKRVPLVWLLQGGVDHLWNPSGDQEQSVRDFQDQGRLKPGFAFEKARILESTGFWCAGPFSTIRAFLAGTAHPGTLRATCVSSVAVLWPWRYEELGRELQQMLQAYLLRKWPTYVRT